MVGDTLHLWLVGGDPDTTKAVPVPDRSIRLQVQSPGGRREPLELAARPLELAGERPGSCSRFEGQAPWLRDLPRFTATGTVTYKGKSRPLRIEYPDGYDPD